MTTENTVIDASVLINFFQIGRVHLLGAHPSTFFVTNQVDGEVIRDAQRRRLLVAIEEGHLVSHQTGGLEKSSLFLWLVMRTSLGVGESSAIAVAAEKDWALATDDGDAIRFVKEAGLTFPVVTTRDIFQELEAVGALTEREARDLYDECGMR